MVCGTCKATDDDAVGDMRTVMEAIRAELHAMHGQACYALTAEQLRQATLHGCRNCEQLLVLLEACVTNVESAS